MSDTEEMSDSEMWDVVRKRGQEKRARNRGDSALMLTESGIPFAVHNAGAHLIVAGRIDFWPGTGLWMERKSNKRHYGVRGLIKHVKAALAPKEPT